MVTLKKEVKLVGNGLMKNKPCEVTLFPSNSGQIRYFVKDKESKEPDAALASAIINECAQNGLLVEGAGTYNNVIRFLAPLVMTDEQLEAGLDIFEAAVAKCAN